MPRLARYANVHILHPVPFSNPNRDDTGAPKTTEFGGTIRGRMSSQSDKRASRVAFEGESDADRTDRTKYATRRLADKVQARLDAAGTDLTDEQRQGLDDAVGDELSKLTRKAEDAKDTLIWLAEAEVDQLAETIVARHTDTGELDLTRPDVDQTLHGATDSLTIAAFGRMFATRADLQIEAAVQVGHAFTTHTQQVDLDYFTAVDDLQASFDTPDEEGNTKGAGAGHLDINEFHSGVFYRYFNVNRHDLRRNWADIDHDTAADRLAAFLDAMIRELPRGREAIAAHQTVPAYVMVTFATRGTSYAPAFEAPVEADQRGYTGPSKAALAAYADKVARIDPATTRLVFDLDDPDSSDLTELIDTTARWLAGHDDTPRPA